MSPSQIGLLKDVRALVRRAASKVETLDAVMKYLHDQCDHYHWVGIYFLKGSTLTLGPYYGPATDHAEIPVGRGVCGTAVAENKNQIIEDVRSLENYLACNLETRSEIVVLIKDNAGKVLGQIDVDGTEVGAFSGEDEFLSQVASLLADHMP